MKLRIPHDAWVLVGDGRKALVLRNEGDEVYPNLKTEQVFQAPFNPATHDQGSDSPGRAFQSVGARRSAVSQTDWHTIAEHRFAQEVAAAMEAAHRAKRVRALVVVAPPRTLADLRASLSSDVKGMIIAEIDKDLTKHPVHEIERLLTAG